jgi:hypothetical protein
LAVTGGSGRGGAWPWMARRAALGGHGRRSRVPTVGIAPPAPPSVAPRRKSVDQVATVKEFLDLATQLHFDARTILEGKFFAFSSNRYVSRSNPSRASSCGTCFPGTR